MGRGVTIEMMAKMRVWMRMLRGLFHNQRLI